MSGLIGGKLEWRGRNKQLGSFTLMTWYDACQFWSSHINLTYCIEPKTRPRGCAPWTFFYQRAWFGSLEPLWKAKERGCADLVSVFSVFSLPQSRLAWWTPSMWWTTPFKKTDFSKTTSTLVFNSRFLENTWMLIQINLWYFFQGCNKRTEIVGIRSNDPSYTWPFSSC